MVDKAIVIENKIKEMEKMARSNSATSVTASGG
jgi:hypothetical protein